MPIKVSSRFRSAAEQSPDHAGEQYRSFANTVALYITCIDCLRMPWSRRTRKAYVVFVREDKMSLTWSAAGSKLTRWNWRVLEGSRTKTNLKLSIPRLLKGNHEFYLLSTRLIYHEVRQMTNDVWYKCHAKYQLMGEEKSWRPACRKFHGFVSLIALARAHNNNLWLAPPTYMISTQINFYV